MHDVAWFEARGVPSAAVLSSGFIKQAHYQAAMLGLQGVGPCLQTVEHPISDQSRAEMADKADNAFDSILEAILLDGRDNNEEEEEEEPRRGFDAAGSAMGSTGGGLGEMDEDAFEEACAS
jgi:hypothetical protein